MIELYFQIAGAFFAVYVFVCTFNKKMTVHRMFLGMFMSVFWLAVTFAIAVLAGQMDDE